MEDVHSLTYSQLLPTRGLPTIQGSHWILQVHFLALRNQAVLLFVITNTIQDAEIVNAEPDSNMQHTTRYLLQQAPDARRLKYPGFHENTTDLLTIPENQCFVFVATINRIQMT